MQYQTGGTHMRKKRVILGTVISALTLCATAVPAGAVTYVPLPENTITTENETSVTNYGAAGYMVTEYDISKKSVSEISYKDSILETSPDVETTPPFDVEDTSATALVKPESEVSTYAVVGTDNRVRVTNTTANPFKKIAYMEMIWPDGYAARATGFMVGNSSVATAGHAVYNKDHGGFASSITVWPGKNEGKTPYGSATATKITIPKVYFTDQDARYDAAVFKINKALGKKTGYFGLRRQNEAFTNEVYVTGYPGNRAGQMWKMKDVPRVTTKYRLTYNIDTTAGQSGSPIYRIYNGKWYAIGIHTTGHLKNGSGYKNSGVIFHSTIYKMLKRYN